VAALVARVPPLALVVAAIVSLQFGAALAATLFDDASAAGIAFLRLGFAALVLLAVWRPRPRDHPRGDLWLAAAFGLTLGLMNLCIYEAIERIPLGIAVTLEFIGPLAVAVFGSRRRLDLLWALLAGAGVVLLSGPGGDLDALGVAFALTAGVAWGSYILIAARAGERFRGGEGLALAMALGTLVPLGPAIASGGSGLLDPEVLVLAFGVAILSSALPYSLETEALRRMPKNVFGVLMSLEPAVAASAGFIVLSQELEPRELAAIALVVAASAGATRSSPAPPGPPEP
jgi:inner membrane transporter RhtA